MEDLLETMVREVWKSKDRQDKTQPKCSQLHHQIRTKTMEPRTLQSPDLPEDDRPRDLVGCPPTDTPEQAELFTFVDYPEKWVFNTTRSKGVLSTDAYLFDDPRGPLLVVFEYRGKEWVRVSCREYGSDSEQDVELNKSDETDLYREHAHHKALYLAKKEERKLSGEMTRTTRRGWK